jgi:hypothetical protein
MVGIERIGSPDVVVQSSRGRQGQPVVKCFSVHVFEFFRIESLNVRGVSSDSSPTIPSESYATKWSDVKENDERVFCPFFLADVQYIGTIVRAREGDGAIVAEGEKMRAEKVHIHC